MILRVAVQSMVPVLNFSAVGNQVGPAADYARDLLDRLQRWKPEPGVADLTHRIRRELTTA